MSRRVGVCGLALAIGLFAASGHSWARPRMPQTAPTAAKRLPSSVRQSLRAAGVPPAAVAVQIDRLKSDFSVDQTLLSWREHQPMNPASVMKLVTTWASLDLLGPSYTWKTHLSAHGKLQAGVLQGALVVRGSGDPKLVVERLQPMLEALQAAGVRRIEGDIVLDRREWNLPPSDPADFDGEGLRPYNSTPDVLLINFKSLVMRFVPDEAAGQARVEVEPPLAGMKWQDRVALSSGPCNDWRSELGASVQDPLNLRFTGRYPLACGERVWPSAYADPERHAERALAGMWQRLGGELTGQARAWTSSDAVLDAQRPVWSQAFSSLPLAEIVRDVNKFSNNVMARHLLLTLGRERQPEVAQRNTLQAGREAVLQWWKTRLPRLTPPALDNGSGLSRRERIRADALAALLSEAARSPVAPVFMDSLPVSGQDQALARRTSLPAGQALLKTGTLRDVTALAGYVRNTQGQWHSFVAIVNHPNASAARPALEELVNTITRQ